MTLTTSTDNPYSGSKSLQLNLQADQSADRWMFLRKVFPISRNWSGYGALSFYLYIPHENEKMTLTFRILSGNSTTKQMQIPLPQDAWYDKWMKITIPLSTSLVLDPSKVQGIEFCICQGAWYQTGQDINFFFDDFTLIEGSMERMNSEQLKLASDPLTIPAAYENLSDPVIYPAVPLEFIYANTDLSARTPLDSQNGIRVQAAKSETKNVTFAVAAGQQDILDLDVQAIDLTDGAGNILAKENIDFRVVKVWEQAGIDFLVTEATQKTLVPELLVKDDRLPFNESIDANGVYQAPSVLNSPFGTDIPSHKVKQVWAYVSVPENITPGEYTGHITISAQQGIQSVSVPFTIQVLPFSLPEPKLYYGTYYDSWLFFDGNKPELYRSRDEIKKDLQMLKKEGFSGLMCLCYYSRENIEAWLQLLAEVGMKGPFVIGKTQDIEYINQLEQQYNVVIYQYGIDEPQASQAKYDQQILKAAEIHENGGDVVTAVTADTLKSLISDNSSLDWANYNDEGIGAYIIGRRSGKIDKLAPFETLYWQYYIENPTYNRYHSGFWLWASGLDGICPYSYQRFPGVLPYSSNDLRAPLIKYPGSDPITMRIMAPTYPCQEGYVSTLEWEGCREGMVDVRYLTYLENLLAEVAANGNTALKTEAESRLNTILNEYMSRPVVDSYLADPYYDPAKFESTRDQLIDLIFYVMQEQTEVFKSSIVLKIKPVFDTKSNGILPVSLNISNRDILAKIDLSSLKLNGVAPVKTKLVCGKINLKFDNLVIAATLGNVSAGDTKELVLTGCYKPEYASIPICAVEQVGIVN
jgi:hypothetical protein